MALYGQLGLAGREKADMKGAMPGSLGMDPARLCLQEES